MIRTQVQIPDNLYDTAKRLAGRMEISLTELVRRGLEYMVSVSSPADSARTKWSLPPAHDLGAADPFAAPGWREEIHTQRANVAEPRARYGGKRQRT